MTDFFLSDETQLRPSDAVAALIIVGTTSHYLMQLRDQKSGIFYPGHWGLFGGAIDPGESPEASLERELKEELGIVVGHGTYFTEFQFDFSFCGLGNFKRRFYEVVVERDAINNLTLGEGSELRTFSADEILNSPRIVPFDAFAIWLHAAGRKVLKCPEAPPAS